MRFGPADPAVDLVALERRVLARWQETELFEQAKVHRKGCPPWVFYEGPPTANARPGLHHVWPRAFKDLWMRFQTMRGFDVPRKGGWDCHGLPVEIEVEKELGLATKGEIEAFGVEEFNRRCRESVRRYVGDFVALTERAAVWIDTRDTYWTLDNSYVESVWWLVRQLHDKGLLFEGHRVTPYCPRCGTALSSHELGQPGAYRDITDTSAWARFPVEGEDFDLLVWTTTPWTLVSNVAAAVGAEIDYVRLRAPEGMRAPGAQRDLVLAAAAVPGAFPEAGDGWQVVQRWKGAELVGLRYRRPFDFLDLPANAPRVVAASFVSTEEGSGIVHIAPAFGADDADVGRAEGLPTLNPVGPDGAFDARVPPWAGRPVKEADADIVAALADRGLLVRAEPYTHAYPHCWRCGTALIYWAKSSWFIRTSEHRGDLMAQNETVNWYPGHIKRGRFGDWLENNVDWALSRDRYWGTPLPVWRCPAGHDTCIGSVAELSERSGRDLSELDLHRPYVDEVVLTCPADGCGQPARRLAPVLDAWFDSGAMPSAQHHYPFDDGPSGDGPSGDGPSDDGPSDDGPSDDGPSDDGPFDDGPSGDGPSLAERYPADFICEAIDQTRGWFYSLLAVNTLVFGSTPYRNVVCLAHVVDEHGLKMSKSKGNVIDPWYVFDTFGSDALRWYFFSAGSPWTSRRVYDDGIREATGKTLLTLWNVFCFFATYADIDGWEPGDEPPPPPTHVLDRWALSRLDAAVASVTTALEEFDALAAASALQAFVDDLSNWYVRRSRARFWASEDGAAHATLHRCLVVTSQLLAPFCPYLAEELYTRLTGEQSVHLSDWPAAGGWADPVLDSDMAAVVRLVGLGRSGRSDASMKQRQPLRRALAMHPGVTLSDELAAEVRDELNVKALEDVESLTGLMTWTVVPNFRALGPRLGAKVNDVKAALAEADGGTVRRALEENGFVEVSGARLGPGDVEVRAASHADFALAQDNDWAVALDLDLDDELRAEGLARELVRELNDLRKRLDLALTDRVALRVAVDPASPLAGALVTHGGWVAAQVLATSLVTTSPPEQGPAGQGAGTTIDVDGEEVSVELVVVPA